MQLRSFALMCIPAFVALVGGVLAAVWHPSRSARSLIQHLAAGVVLAALAVEVLPDIAHEHAPKGVLIIAFGVGTLFMFGLKLWTKKLEHRKPGEAEGEGSAVGLVLATFIDVAVDGFIIGAGFAAGGSAGPILATGLAVELLFLGLALTSEKLSGWRIVVLAGGLGVDVLVCAVLGAWLLAGTSHAVIGAALAFGAAALLYLVTEELLMEAHETPEKPYSMLVLFGGFLAFWSIQLLGSE